MMKSLLNELFNFLFRFAKIQRVVFFSNILDDYNDNPRAISECLYRMCPEIRQVWTFTDSVRKCNYPNYITLVKTNSLIYWYWKNSAKVLVDNSVGFQTTNGRLKRNLLIRRNQVNYSTWHGTPMKRIGLDNMFSNVDYSNFYSSSTLMILGSEYERRVFESAYNSRLKIQLLGNPRNDCLIHQNQATRKHLIEKYCTSKKHIVIYAPTYRDVYDRDDFYSDINDKTIGLLKDALSKKFGGEWIFAYRFHHFDNIRKVGISNQHPGVVDVSTYPDMNEFLAICDVLITDYSGSLFDFMLTQRPCFLFLPDYEKYRGARGLYLAPDDLPWPHCFSIHDLIDLIYAYDDRLIQSKVRDFLCNTQNVNDGGATDRVCKIIKETLQ